MRCYRAEDGTEVILRVEGELDANTAPEFRGKIDAIVAAAPAVVTLDLSGLRTIDSSGVGALIALYKRMRAAGGRVWIVGACDQPQAILQLLRLDTVFSRT